jgi:hypothetical protein
MNRQKGLDNEADWVVTLEERADLLAEWRADRRDLRRVRMLWLAARSRRAAPSRTDRQSQEDPTTDARA